MVSVIAPKDTTVIDWWRPHTPPRGNTAFFFLFFAVVAGLSETFAVVDGRSDLIYEGELFALIVLSFAHLVNIRQLNLGASFSFFAMFFFGFIPLFEFTWQITYNGANIPSIETYRKAAALALLSSVCFYLGYGWRRGQSFYIEQLRALQFHSRRHQQLIIWLVSFSLILLGFGVAASYSFSPKQILFRGYGEEVEQSAFGYSFITYFARPLFFNIVLLVMMAYSRRTKVPRASLIALFLVVSVIVSPVGIPRSLAGALFIPLMMLVFLPKFNSKYGVICLIVFAILFAAPLADIFRRINQPKDVDYGGNYNLDYLFAGHFDAFHNLAQVIEFHYASEGYQVLGILLFWVPRALWAGKPVSTSFDFADYAGFRSGNVSFPLTAEYYVDYGATGVAIGMIVLGLLYRRLDSWLDKPRAPGSVESYVFAALRMELSLLGIYLLRGSVLSSFAFTMGVAGTLASISIAERWIRGSINRG